MLFPPPLGPTSATVSPGASSSSSSSRTAPSRAGYAYETPSKLIGPSSGLGGASEPVLVDCDSSTRPSMRVGHRPPVGARVELRREIAEREVELGREHQDRQCRLEADPALDQPDPDYDCDEGDPERRGELEHRPGQERDAKRAHGRAPVLAADFTDPLGLRAATVERAQRRQPAHDVQEVRRQQRERLPALPSAMLRVPAQKPHEDGDERERDEHDPGGDRIDRGDEHENRNRHDEREDHLRQVAGERRLESVHARDGCCRDLGALDAVERSGCARSLLSTSSRRSCEPTSTAARLPATSNPHAAIARAATTPSNRTSGVATASSDAPSKPRAATRARRTACARTRNAATTPRAASTASRTRTGRARCRRRESNGRTRRGYSAPCPRRGRATDSAE